MRKSHTAGFHVEGVKRDTQWLRNSVASFVLLACLVSLSIILHNRYGARVAATLVDGFAAFDVAELMPLADTPPMAMDADALKHRTVGAYLARRYKVSSEVTTNIVAKAYTVGRELHLDPMLILAVISVESRFNPIAESTMGAKGLMQVIPRYHLEKFVSLGGEKVVFEPEANIVVGAKILKEYMRRTGDMADALQMYVGATTELHGNGYSSKVMVERDRLNQVLRQHHIQPRAEPRLPAMRRPAVET